MFLILTLYLYKSKQLKTIFNLTKENNLKWLIWSHIGFGVFYTMLTFASTNTEPWLIASTWQITIIAGILLSPFIEPKSMGRRTLNLPILPLFFGIIIITGVLLVNQPSSNQSSFIDTLISILPIIIAAFAYPLGNRKTMQLASGHLTVLQRVYAMTLYSMPLWVILSFIGLSQNIIPTVSQVTQSFSNNRSRHHHPRNDFK